jgi:hypothetical protein
LKKLEIEREKNNKNMEVSYYDGSGRKINVSDETLRCERKKSSYSLVIVAPPLRTHHTQAILEYNHFIIKLKRNHPEHRFHSQQLEEKSTMSLKRIAL